MFLSNAKDTGIIPITDAATAINNSVVLSLIKDVIIVYMGRANARRINTAKQNTLHEVMSGIQIH
jgi:hypothetical protein